MASNQGVPPPTYNQLMVLLAKVCQSQLTANERFTQLMDMHEKTLRTVTETTQMLKAMADNNNIFKASTSGYAQNCGVAELQTTTMASYVPSTSTMNPTWHVEIVPQQQATGAQNEFTLINDALQACSAMVDVNGNGNVVNSVVSDDNHDARDSDATASPDGKAKKRTKKKLTEFKGGSAIWQYYDFHENCYACNVDNCDTKYFSARPHVPTAINHLRTSHPHSYEEFLQKSKGRPARRRAAGEAGSPPQMKQDRADTETEHYAPEENAQSQLDQNEHKAYENITQYLQVVE